MKGPDLEPQNDSDQEKDLRTEDLRGFESLTNSQVRKLVEKSQRQTNESSISLGPDSVLVRQSISLPDQPLNSQQQIVKMYQDLFENDLYSTLKRVRQDITQVIQSTQATLQEQEEVKSAIEDTRAIVRRYQVMIQEVRQGGEDRSFFEKSHVRKRGLETVQHSPVKLGRNRRHSFSSQHSGRSRSHSRGDHSHVVLNPNVLPLNHYIEVKKLEQISSGLPILMRQKSGIDSALSLL